MASSLAAQLAHIRADSSNSLDIKAQKKAHSKSLIFPPHDAALQDFDTIFEICFDGFEELCRIDPRFTEFAGSIFSAQSKYEDRTQMSLDQNQHLDVVLQDFLGLVGERLHLEPAQKAVEWLVRRFRIHENNTTSFVFTFLPYHSTSFFLTVLSILPNHIPTIFKFLHPYRQSSTFLPRHAIVHAAAHNKGFLETFGTHVIALCQKNYQNPVLLSFWATITTEALTVKLSQNPVESHKELKKTQEDSIIRILSLLSRALSFKSIPGLKVACYMILTVIGCKRHLGDDILTSIMNAVTVGWESTINAGIICLSALAQRREDFRLPKQTLKALLAVKTIASDLVTLGKHYNVERLAFGLVLGVIDKSRKQGFPENLVLAQTVIEANLLRPTYIAATIRAMVNAVQENSQDTKLTQKSKLETSLADIVSRLADVKMIGHIVRDVLEGSEIHTRLVESDVEQAENALGLNLKPPIEIRTAKPEDILTSSESFEALVNRIPTQMNGEKSFLSRAESCVFGSLSDAFVSACQSSENLDQFCNLPVLRKPFALTEPLFISFFIRTWCGPSAQAVRAAAITVILNYLREQQHIPDVQILLPYIIYALADPSNAVRNAAAQLTLVLDQSCSRIALQNMPNRDQEILGQDQFYGQGKESKRVTWLAEEEVTSLIRNILVPNIEECRLDAAQIPRYINACLKKGAVSKGSKQYGSELKKSLKLSVFTTLCDHIVSTPLYRVKARLLPIVTRIGSVGNTSCSKLMMPLLDQTWNEGQQGLETICEKEQIDVLQFANCLMEIISPIDKDSIKFLQNMIISCDPSFTIFIKTSFQRLCTIWSVMKHQSQLDFANAILEIAFPAASDNKDLKQTEAASTLQKVSLSALILQNFLDSLPRLSRKPSQPPAAKRRRVSHETAMDISSTDISPLLCHIKKIYFLLELLEGLNSGKDPRLLDGLFRLLGDLLTFGRQAGTKFDYLELMAVENLLSVSKSVEANPDLRLDKSTIRVDLLIDCIEVTTNVQLQQSTLLLLATLARINPDLVLNNIMPIFTHISKGLLRENDDYSAQVVEKTMVSVIPRIVTSLQKRDEDPIASISKLMLNFVAAFEFIPPFRRTNVFSGLVRQLGADRYLYALLVLLIDKFPRNEQILQFCSDLMEQHDIQTQLICFENLIKVILDLQMPKPTLSNYLVSTASSKSTEYNSTVLLVSFTTVVMDERFRAKMAKAPAHGEHLTEKVQALFSNLISQVSLLSESKQQGNQFNSLCVKALNALFDVLPTSDLVQTFKYLLDNSNNKVTRQALSSFESRLKSLRPAKKSIRQACLDVVPQLLGLVETSPDRLLRLTALHCIEHIAKLHARNDGEAVEKIVKVISSDHCLKSEDVDFQVAAILCLSTLVEVLRDGFTSYLPQVLAIVLKHFDNSIKDVARTARLHNACCSFFTVLLLHISWLMTGSHLDCILKACHGSAAGGMDAECNTERKRMMMLVAKSIEPQHLYASLSTTWSSAVCNGPEALQEHLQLLNDVLGRQSKSAMTLQSKSIWDLLLKAFDLRYTLSTSSDRMGYDDSEVEDLERSARSTAVSMIYKLNDTTFRPLFIQGLEWTQASNVEDTAPNIDRQITWFYFLLEFFGNLKAVVTSYAGLIVEDVTQILNAEPTQSVQSMLLWKRVLLTLQQSFKHDQEEFWQSPSHFDPVCQSLTAQFQHASKVAMESEVIPAVTELAVAADSANHHRSLNACLLPLLRSDHAAVRLAVVHCELNLTSRLGEEWLSLLPEMLPLISELQEDDDEDVYAATSKWIGKIEEILGESISPMLQ